MRNIYLVCGNDLLEVRENGLGIPPEVVRYVNGQEKRGAKIDIHDLPIEVQFKIYEKLGEETED